MPRNSRSNRSSASIVTLVSSSPFHQPSASCSDSRCETAAAKVARASGVTLRSLLRSGASVTSALSRHDEAAERNELVASRVVQVRAGQGFFADSEAAARLLRGPGTPTGGLDQGSCRSDVVVAVGAFARQPARELGARDSPVSKRPADGQRLLPRAQVAA